MQKTPNSTEHMNMLEKLSASGCSKKLGRVFIRQAFKSMWELYFHPSPNVLINSTLENLVIFSVDRAWNYGDTNGIGFLKCF